MWKDIINWEGYYQVSDNGCVRSLPRIVYRNGKPLHISGKILTPKSDNRGYLTLSLYRNNREYNCLVHRLVAQTFIPI